MKIKPRISIVILNWNGAHFLQMFLPSLVEFSKDEAEIIIADNGSTDKSREVSESFHGIKFLQLEKNYGFAEGYNRALEIINNDYYLLLNSDVEVSKDWLKPLLSLMDANPLAGICQPKIKSLNKPKEFEYAGASGGFLDKYGYPFCRGRILQEIETDTGQYDQGMQVFWASGACMMVRSALWKECGGFDKDFWAHMEEIDLCWRASHLGYQIHVCPESTVFHLGGGTLTYNNPLKIYLNFRNNLFLLFKNLPENEFLSTLFIRMVLDGLAAASFLVKGEVKAFRSVLKAHLDFYRQLSILRQKREAILAGCNAKLTKIPFRKSILWEYFIRRRRKYSLLKLK